MEHPNTRPCSCELCLRGVPPTGHLDTSQQGSANTSQAQGPLVSADAPKNYNTIFRQLREEGTISINAKEMSSPLDFRAERKVLTAMVANIPKQSSFIPRVGELVLYCRKLEGKIVLDLGAKESRMHDTTSGQDIGHPPWLAGIITQVPAEEVSIKDLLKETTERHAIDFRVECFPDPNGSAQGLSKQYSYVPMHHIRPMCFWKEALEGIPDEKWHPSILNALSVTATMSTVERYGATGTWPNCNIHCKGIFIGFEALFIGDAVRFTTIDTTVWGVLVIKDIQFQFEGLAVAEDGEIHPSSADARYIELRGESYTLDPQRSYKGMELNLDEFPGSLPSGMRGYNKWYHMSEPGTHHIVTYDWVVGRLFEADAMRSWFTPSIGDLNTGVSGVRIARDYSARKDKRINTQRGEEWFWGSYRTDSLDVEESETFNGFEVREYHTGNVRVINGVVMRGSRKTVAGKGPRRTVGMKGPWKGGPEPDKTSMQDDEPGEGAGEETGSDELPEETVSDELPEDHADSTGDGVDAVDDGVISGMP